MVTPSRINYAVAALIAANIIMGISVPIFKLIVDEIPIYTFIFIRFFTAGLIFLPFAIPMLKKVTWQSFILISIASFLGLTLHIGAFFHGLAKTSSINAGLIFSAGPVVLYFLSIKFLKEKQNLRILCGMLIAMAGVIFVILAPFFSAGERLAYGMIEGNLLLFLALITHMFAVLIKKSVLNTLSPIVVICLFSLIGSLGFLPGVVSELPSLSAFSYDRTFWAVLIFGTLITSVLGHYLLVYGLSKIKAEEVGLFTYIDPVATVLIAVPLLGEIPGPSFLIGALFVFGGIYIAEGRIHWHPLHKLHH